MFVFITAAAPPLALSLAVTFGTVPPVEGKLTAASSMASTVEATATVTEPEQAGALPVHNGSPPPVTVAVLLPPVAPTTAVAPTVIGTVTVIGPTELVGIVQPDKLTDPVETAQLPKGEPLTRIAPLVVMPVGSTSVNVIAAVVGPFSTLIVMV